MSDTAIDRLQRQIPSLKLSQAPDDLKEWGRDWTRFYEPRPRAIAFPKTRDEVCALMKFCHHENLAVVPSGGRSGLSAGAVATQGEIVLSLSKLNAIETFDPLTATLRVQAGAIHQNVQDFLAPLGWQWPVDLASKGSCQIGGNVATNAGGLHVIRYGHARKWILSLEVVLADGQLLELNGDLEKNNSGYSLKDLIIGSEGTLAIITAVTLKLAPKIAERQSLLIGCAQITDAYEILSEAKQKQLPLLAFEFFSQACLEAVQSLHNLPSPLPQSYPFYVLLDFEEIGESALEVFSTKILEEKWARDAVAGSDEQSRRRLWQYRERITESLAHKGFVYKNDLALPLRKLPLFLQELRDRLADWYPGAEIYEFGHLGDGNVHLNIVFPGPVSNATAFALCEARNEELFSLLQKYSGSISAEHGIGLLKKKYLHFCKSPAEIEIYRRIKRAWDPTNILNPGKILDL